MGKSLLILRELRNRGLREIGGDLLLDHNAQPVQDPLLEWIYAGSAYL